MLFLDEFDAIAKLRGDEQEHGELKRVVNSFIQNLDALGTMSVLIAATNHEELLDRAIWRRFSYRMELSFPSVEERVALWNGSLHPLEFTQRDVVVLSDLSEGFSGSDIHEACQRLHRRRITTGTAPALADAFSILRNLTHGEGTERKFVSLMNSHSPQKMAQMLRQRNPKLYSHSTISSLLGISKATSYRCTKGGTNDHDGR